MLKNLNPTSKQLFIFSLLGLIVGLALLFLLVFTGSQRAILKSSIRFRDSASQMVTNDVTEYLHEAPAAVEQFEREMKYGLVDPRNFESIQANLLSMLLANEHLLEVSFTYGDSKGFDFDGDIQLVPGTAGQVSVFRTSVEGKDGREKEQFISRHTWYDGKKFVCESRALQKGAQAMAIVADNAPCADPTEHLTFKTPAQRDYQGQLLWTDLHWSQLDEELPVEKRRVEVSVQKSILNTHSQFAGVLRVGLVKEEIDRTLQRIAPDSHGVFLCDAEGRLITGFGNGQKVEESRDDLRVSEKNVPPEILMALRQPELKTVNPDNPLVSSEFRIGSKTYLCTFRALDAQDTEETRGWIVGIVVDRGHYLGEVVQIQHRVIWASLILICGIVLIGGLILRGVGRAHSLVLRETERMNAFEFSASSSSSRLRDINDVLTSLEKAKTAMRAMGRYVPIDLVRWLYRDGREPVLGGDAIELSLLFTDIKDFTPFAEQTAPDRLAEILGLYLDVMASAIQRERGTIDKYIGDAVMAFWNAPERVENHAFLACRAALQCRAGLQALYLSSKWKGLAALETRFGLHRGMASVGHFGSPDRFNYTAIGDNVNLASRLEGLNKYYGTHIIASEAIYSVVKNEFAFRILDRVSVKGKAQGVIIYELLGEANSEKSAAIVAYERAFEAYQRGDFRTALATLEAGTQDAPGKVLAKRCRLLIEHPPGENWTGIHIFDSK